VLGGLLGAGPMVGALAGVVATLPVLAEPWLRMAAICTLVLIFVAPLLLVRTPAYPDGPADHAAPSRVAAARTDFILLWCARLLVQIAGSVMFGFLFYYFRSLPEPPSAAGIARLSALAVVVGFPVALALGARSDQIGRRQPFLIAAAVAAALGLGLMAWATALVPSVVGYLLFGCASAVFLALHAGYAMQLLPSPTRRGRDLGVINLANTIPSVIAPLLAIWLVPGRGFGPLLALLTFLMLLAATCILFVSRDEQVA
jgi:MFS family permease